VTVAAKIDRDENGVGVGTVQKLKGKLALKAAP
jgi:hypothetical protein